MISATLFLALSQSTPFFYETFVTSDSTPLGELDSGLIGDDLSPDAVLLASGKLDYVHDAGGIAARMTAVASGVDSMTVAPDDGSVGSDSVFYSTQTGLFLLRKSAGNGATFTTTNQSRPEFAGNYLSCQPWDDGLALIGLKNGEVTRATWDGTTLGTATSFVISGTVHDVQTMNWDGVGGSEYVALVDNGFKVFSGSGTLLYSLSASAPGQLAISRSTAVGERDVAVWAVLDVSTQLVVRVHSSALKASTASNPTEDLIAIDYDGDGHDDIVRIGHTTPVGTVGDGELLLRQAGTSNNLNSFFLAGGSFSTVATCHNVAVTATYLCATVADFDNDGDEDLFTALSNTDTHDLRIKLNHTENEELMRFAWVAEGVVVTSGTPELTSIQLSLPNDPSFPMTHIAVEMWGSETVAGGRTFQTMAEYTSLVEVADEQGAPKVSWPYTVNFSTTPPPQIRIYAITQVRIESGVLVDRGPSTILMYTPNSTLRTELVESLPEGCLYGGDPTNGSGAVNAGRGGQRAPGNT